MEKFTKGEWQNNGRLVYSRDAVFIATASKTDIEDFSEIEANAALIAAAPEMYEVIINGIGQFGGTLWARKAEELLSKARGEK